jgi:photosystem II stability/assembly factor-like uncharacterized protein
MYARTDVGGAYRWDASAQKWIPITDWIGPDDNNFFGIESIALDAHDTNWVYLAAGTYQQGRAAILRSDDQGRTFQRAAVPFKMGGNDTGRFNGERLAVDPNLGSTLFFGTRHDGLWKSVDHGATWKKIETFPGDYSGFSVGIVSVVFDPSSGQTGTATPVLFAALSATATNIFASSDAGATWQAVTNQPAGLRPNHLIRSPDGILYVTYGREPGPNTMTDGAVWKFNPKNSVWTDITPVKPKESDQPFGYGDVSVDARNPSIIVVTTFCHWHPHDEVFRSTNGGSSWKPLLQGAVYDHAAAPYTASRTPHWMGTVQIDPFNSEQILFTTGYGIWSSTDATQADAGKRTHWVFLDQGLEETVPLALISPPEGAHLLSGVGDIDGFRHDVLNESPAEGSFPGPRFGNTEDMAFAALNPSVIVRTGTGGRRGGAHSAISDDGGKTWTALASEPANSRAGRGIALSADGKIIVYTPLRGVPCHTTDRGVTWTPCAGLQNGLRVVADPINASGFYSLDSRDGKLLVSTNGALEFRESAEFNGDGNASLYATPGLPADLWAAHRNGGLYHATNPGTNFTKVDRVENVDAFGFGQPAPGKTFPALFLAGKIGGVRAIFRSDDSGQNWVRITDDQHQFGYISHLTGDPRIYGRVYLATGGRGIIYGDIGNP